VKSGRSPYIERGKLITRDDLELGEEDYVEVLSDLVHRYEAEHDPIAPVPDSDLVRFLLESNVMAQTELAQRTEISESTISAILAGKRMLSRRHIAALAKVFRVSPALFVHQAIVMTPERIADVLSRHDNTEFSHDLLVSLASAFAMEPHGVCWRALQELVAGDRPGTPTDLMAKQRYTSPREALRCGNSLGSSSDVVTHNARLRPLRETARCSLDQAKSDRA
jgi:HTH-type transcriptional regulator / antitoxin HigA